MKKEFPELLQKNWKRLLAEGQDLTFRKGQVLVYEGHHPYGIFVLKSGKVEFTREGFPSSDQPLQEVPGGEAIGLDCLMSGGLCCCTCRATEDCRVIFISKTQLSPFLKDGKKKGKELEIHSV